MKVLIIVIIVVAGVFYNRLNQEFFPTCVFSEKTVSIPPDLKDAVLTLEKDSFVVVGHHPDYANSNCTKILYDVAQEIYPSRLMNESEKMYVLDYGGRTVDELKAPREFTLEKIVAGTKHGIASVDSGTGPFYSFILKDKDDNLYYISPAHLGYDDRQAILSFQKANSKVWLSWQYVKNAYGYNQ